MLFNVGSDFGISASSLKFHYGVIPRHWGRIIEDVSKYTQVIRSQLYIRKVIRRGI